MAEVFTGYRCDALSDPETPSHRRPIARSFCTRKNPDEWGKCVTPDFVCPVALQHLQRIAVGLEAGYLFSITSHPQANTLILQVDGSRYIHVIGGRVQFPSELDSEQNDLSQL